VEQVHIMDQKYSGANAVKCPNEGKRVKLPQSGAEFTEHGDMQVHGSGAFLVCGVCDNKLPIGRV
jgi:hypothetical protein